MINSEIKVNHKKWHLKTLVKRFKFDLHFGVINSESFGVWIDVSDTTDVVKIHWWMYVFLR